MTHTITPAVLVALALAGGAQAGTSTSYSSNKGPVVTPAPEPVAGPYLDVSAGPLWISDINDIGFDTGWTANGEIGWDFGNGLRVGVQGGYGNADLEEVNYHYRGFHIHGDGEIDLIPVMANVSYTRSLMGDLSFYVAGGAGALYTNTDTEFDVRRAGLRIGDSGESDDWNFALQVRAGLAWQVCPTSTLNVGYRYIHAFLEDDDLSAHVLEGGFAWKF